MTIKTEDCKKAIVDFVMKQPGYIAKQFVDVASSEIASFEAPALKEKNWARRDKYMVSLIGDYWPSPGKAGDICCRSFDCRPYDDQLRAYTWDDGSQILKILVEGE